VLVRELNEVDIVQNGALGAAILWRFGTSYQGKSASVPPLMPLMFVVLPVCLHAQTIETLLSTRKNSGLGLFAAKLGETRENLIAVHSRALAFRSLSLHSISIGIQASLLSVDYQNATVRSNDLQPPTLPERIKPTWEAAGRLGYWCASLELRQIASLLRLDF
jgi:hypothetical protein